MSVELVTAVQFGKELVLHREVGVGKRGFGNAADY